jgi:hypothetical protein
MLEVLTGVGLGLAGCSTGDGKLSADVTGIVATNGLLHARVVEEISKATGTS